MGIEHQPVVIECEGSELIGIIEHPSDARKLGVLIVTGGPQYRIGSHRQFVNIARKLAEKGTPVMRFDYRGMGDSGGEQIRFDQCSADLRAAIDSFVRNTKIRHVALWGLCDAASACMIYGPQDARVAAIILLNPWVRTDAGLAQAYIKNYYSKRLCSRDFWRKLIAREFSFSKAVREFTNNVRLAIFGRHGYRGLMNTIQDEPVNSSFQEKMFRGLKAFRGPVLFLLSGDDLTAAEFISYTKRSRYWRRILRRRSITVKNLALMDHTFSTAAWREEIINQTCEWIDAVEKMR